MAAVEHPGYIYDEETGKVLYFDAIVKVQHTVALKIEDDPDKIQDGSDEYGNQQKKYINNAINEADEVSFDVVMSNVHTDTGDLPGSTGDRCVNAYTVLREIKTSRRKVKVITTYATYSNMLIKAIQLLQDETNTYGWSASITFHEAIAKTEKPWTAQTKSAADERAESTLSAGFGTLIPTKNGSTVLPPAEKSSSAEAVNKWVNRSGTISLN